MNKQVEQIRAEVYRRFVEAGIHEGMIAETREDELNSLLSFIDSMPEDRPEPISPADVGFEALGKWWDRDYQSTTLDNKDFPDLKWEDKPIYVKLVTIKEDKV
jgi:hypothetical protein